MFFLTHSKIHTWQAPHLITGIQISSGRCLWHAPHDYYLLFLLRLLRRLVDRLSRSHCDDMNVREVWDQVVGN